MTRLNVFFFTTVCVFLVQIFTCQGTLGERVKREAPSESCSRSSLECDNGQCVPESNLCDGIRNCFDGTDESPEACRIKYPHSCSLPTNWQNNTSLIINCGTATSIQFYPSTKGDFVRELTLVTCDSGSAQFGQYQSLCLNGEWTIPLSECFETCRTLPQLENINITKCHVNDQERQCNKTNAVSTILEPRCEWNTFANRENAICTTNGQWNVPKLKCIECGKNFKNPGYSHQLVEIYSRSFSGRSCFGTFVSPYLVITNAECLTKRPPEYVQLYSFSYFHTKLGFTPQYEEMEIIKIHYPDSSANSNENDVAILEIKGYLLWYKNISIPCLDWNEAYPINPNIDLLVPNIADNRAEGSNVFLPPLYADRNACTTTKWNQICVQYRNGKPIPHYWKGSGVFVENKGKYYLKGIAGRTFTKINSTTAVITYLSKHLAWIRYIISTTDLQRRKNPPLYNAPWVTKLDPPIKRIPTVKKDTSLYKNFAINCSGEEMHRKFVDGCILPNKTLYNVNYQITCQGNTFESYCGYAKEGDPIPQHTGLQYNCTEGFASYSPEASLSVCFRGVWTPPITYCGRKCKQLEPKNVILKCTYEGREVNCDTTLIANTEVTPASCIPEYRMEDPTKCGLIYCREDGQWSGTLIKCIPKCGHPFQPNTTSRIHHGDVVTLGELPWHAAVYDKKRDNTNMLICGATIISPYILLSAAHCFYTGSPGIQREASEFEIAVGKITRDRNRNDSEITVFYEIERIISNKKYRGIELRYQGDIVILVTKTKISFNSHVLPVCMYNDTNTGMAKNALLEIAGWGIDETGNPSDSLIMARTPYISYEECSEKASVSTLKFLSTDKFCSGSTHNITLDRGDSGGGFIYRSSTTSPYYLVGIVSSGMASSQRDYSLGISVQHYLPWITQEVTEIHKFKNYV